MAKIIGISVIILFLFGCGKQYEYQIIGSVMVNDTLRKAIWFTDTISFKNDTAYYVNSDNSVVEIVSPYEIYQLKTRKWKTIQSLE